MINEDHTALHLRLTDNPEIHHKPKPCEYTTLATSWHTGTSQNSSSHCTLIHLLHQNIAKLHHTETCQKHTLFLKLLLVMSAEVERRNPSILPVRNAVGVFTLECVFAFHFFAVSEMWSTGTMHHFTLRPHFIHAEIWSWITPVASRCAWQLSMSITRFSKWLIFHSFQFCLCAIKEKRRICFVTLMFHNVCLFWHSLISFVTGGIFNAFVKWQTFTFCCMIKQFLASAMWKFAVGVAILCRMLSPISETLWMEFIWVQPTMMCFIKHNLHWKHFPIQTLIESVTCIPDIKSLHLYCFLYDIQCWSLWCLWLCTWFSYLLCQQITQEILGRFRADTEKKVLYLGCSTNILHEHRNLLCLVVCNLCPKGDLRMFTKIETKSSEENAWKMSLQHGRFYPGLPWSERGVLVKLGIHANYIYSKTLVAWYGMPPWVHQVVQRHYGASCASIRGFLLEVLVIQMRI